PKATRKVPPLRIPKKLSMTTSPRPESVPESESNTQTTAPAEEPAGAMTFFEHLSELRKRIIYSLYAIGIGAFIGVYISKYFITLPYILRFLVSFQGPISSIKPMITVNEYFDLVLLILLGLGLVFELPILIFFLSLFGIVTPKFLWKNFRYAILVIAIVAAIV